MFDKKFISLSLHKWYENEQQKPCYPVRCEHDHALADSAFVRADIHDILQAIGHPQLPSYGARIVRIQRNDAILHHPRVGFHH